MAVTGDMHPTLTHPYRTSDQNHGLSPIIADVQESSQEYLGLLEKRRARLLYAWKNKRSVQWCLRLWSAYIKTRDNFRCVLCDAKECIQAHHIWRRVTYPHGWYELGNGITLCKECHKKAHKEFNGRPSPSEPINARGGDDQDEIAFLYGMLWEDAVSRGLDEDRYYYICDHMLEFFMKVQGHREMHQLVLDGHISRIRCAHEIWRNMPEEYDAYVAQLIGLNLFSTN